MQQAKELQEAFECIINLHREEFVLATKPVAPAPMPVDYSAVRHQRERQALRGLNIFQRSARASARKGAAEAATVEVGRETAKQHQEHAEIQRQLDEQWQRLLANDPDTVFTTLTEAFEDNEAPAAVAGVNDDEVSVVVMAPDVDAVPERMPKLTEAGNLSLAKLTKSLRNSFYVTLVSGHLLVTVREALAVAPGIRSVRVVVVRWTPPNAYGMRGVECLLAAVFTRDALQGIQWQTADAPMIVNDASSELCIRQGAANELRPLDLSNEPALAELLQAVDLQDLGGAPEKDEPATSASQVKRGTSPRPPKPGSQAAVLPSETPPPWRPRPGWGTIRDYSAVTNEHGGTDIRCKFVPDDGAEPVQLFFRDTPMPELGEYTRGIMPSRDNLIVKVHPAGMIDAEQNVFREINEMEPAQRALMYAQGYDLHEDCGWAWTPDYKLVKAAPGLVG